VKLELLANKWPGAVVLIWQEGFPSPAKRAAAFLYDLPGGGFAWVEPSYLDAFGPASPASHMRPRATLRLINENVPEMGFAFEDPEDTREHGMVYPYRRDDSAPVPELEAFAASLAASGTTLAAERERIRPAITGA
jgi:hypothetical protein